MASYYKCLVGEGRGQGLQFPWRSIWVFAMPTKISFFVWAATLGRVLPIDNLIRRRQVLVNWCCMCRANTESIPHLLLHCSMAHQLWTVALALFGMAWVQLRSIGAVLWSWKGGRVGRRRKKVWAWVLLCLMWLILLE